MLAAGDSVLMAVSGGADSVALAKVLYTLAAEYPVRLAIAHLNHCLRKEDSERDAEFVADFARQLNLPFYLEKKDVLAFQRSSHLSLEETARKIRYEFLVETAAKYGFTKIATGHHGNDNAEQVLMNLLRGSGPLGLSGIAPVRDNKIVRPLIRLKRFEILAYAAEKKLPFVTDISNTDLTIRRNRIRHHLIPELEKSYNPRIIETLNRLGMILRAEDQWIEDALSTDFKKCISCKGPGAIRLDTARFTDLATAAKRRIIRRAILSVKKDLRRITLLHVDAVLALIERDKDFGFVNLPAGIRATRNAAELTIAKYEKNRSIRKDRSAGRVGIKYRYTIFAPGASFIKEAGATITLVEIGTDELPDFKYVGSNLAFFDLDRLNFPLIVRNIRPGDRFSPLGVTGTQKVKEYFINNKIPQPRRQICPLLLSGDEIVWIAGHRIDNRVKIVPATRHILKAELLLA
jgi:tRNA(Ile)-lysidine synthase